MALKLMEELGKNKELQVSDKPKKKRKILRRAAKPAVEIAAAPPPVNMPLVLGPAEAMNLAGNSFSTPVEAVEKLVKNSLSASDARPAQQATDVVRVRLSWQSKTAVSRCDRVIDDPNFVVLIFRAGTDRSLLHIKTPTLYEPCRLRVRYNGEETSRQVMSGACRFQDGGHIYVLFFVIPDSM
jgi:hypothetical protein